MKEGCCHTGVYVLAIGIITSGFISLNASAAKSGDIRLAGSSNPNQGRVEIYFGDQWGTVCDDNWDKNDAFVVCLSLGYAGAKNAYVGAAFGKGSGPILLDDVNCQGNESSLANCKHRGWGVHDCQHSEDAGVECLEPKSGIPSTLQMYEFDRSSDFSSHLNKLYDSKLGCDFYFLINAPKNSSSLTICTHKLILSMNSELKFLKENDANNYSMTVEEECLPYIDDFIRYLYSRHIKITLLSAQCIHKMASSYGAKELQEYCGQLFSHLLPQDPTFKSQVAFYNYALETGDALLEELCLQFLAWNLEAFTKSLAWFDLNIKQLRVLLERSDLVIPSEIFLLKALEAWTLKRKISDPKNVSELLDCIRFAMMPPDVLFEAQLNLTLYETHEDKFHSKYVQALIFHTVPFQKLKQHTDLSKEAYTPRLYTDTWGYLYNSSYQPSTIVLRATGHHDYLRYGSYSRYQHQTVTSNPSITFTTPKHSSSLYKSETMSWSVSYYSSSESCRNLGSSCSYDTYPVLLLSPQSYTGSDIQYENKALMVCNGFYVSDVQDFKNNVAVVPQNGSQSVFPCSSKYSVYRYIVRPVYFRK
ncbi:galectin-3-binding protein-like isoform X2 [Protopterus annectens]|uniref:galectin-3-binding protein-like isoform X2 n=1 Tax=Protopterus annectens TaxID=7888 RepID=UPI001CFA5789|nr:galectin-3-binding protein-like isoform X2 [Protopterus annectens]